MQLKNKLAALTALIISVTLASCNIGVAEPPTPSAVIVPTLNQAIPNTGTSCDNPLYPVRQNAAWTYSNTGGQTSPFTYTDTITNVRVDGFTLTSQFSNLTRTQEWLCKPEGLQALQLGGGTAAVIATQGLTANFTTSDVTGITLPANITPGLQWTYGLNMQGTMATPSDQNAEANGSVSVVMQEMGTESITVPAGTFNAAKIQATSTFDIMASFQGVGIPVKFTGTSILWYAPGVGLVKSVDNGDFGGSTFSATTELQSYNIP